MTRFPEALRALNSRNYRLFFTAQTISMTGMWMYRVAIGWLVFRLTDSNSALGLMDFVASLPVFFLSPLAGAVVERLDLRKLVFRTQAGCMLIAFAFALLTFTNLITYEIILALVLARGLLDAFELPARYSLVSYMVDRRDDLGNAVALNSTLFNTARMIGPTVGGFVIHAFGESFCFFSNGFCYLSTLWALKKMRLARPPIGKTGGKSRPFRDMIEGVTAARDFAPYRYFLLMISFTGFFAFPSIALMPAMAKSVLHGTSKTLGFLLMGVAAGALAGSLLMASRKNPSRHSWWCTRGCVAFGLCVAIFSLSRFVWLSIILAAPLGFCLVTCTIACNTLLQTMTPPENRSRIMALYTLANIGIPPFGSMIAGRFGDLTNTGWALFACGLCCAASSYYFLRKIDGIDGQVAAALKRQGALQ